MLQGRPVSRDKACVARAQQGQFSLLQGKARVVIAWQVSTRCLLLNAHIVTRESTPVPQDKARVAVVQLENIQLRWELHQVVIVKRAMLARTL